MFDRPRGQPPVDKRKDL